jgi:hypothetical protein
VTVATKIILMTIDNLQQHGILQYAVFKDEQLKKHHDVALSWLEKKKKTKQFVAATVVRRSLVGLC